MCFIRSNENDLRYAIRDRIVYKVFRDKLWNKNSYFSPFKDFEYTPNKLYETEFSYRRSTYLPTLKINPNSFFTHDYRFVEYIDFSQIYQGFHSYKNYESADEKWFILPGMFKVVKCIVPKGSWYYINNNGEIVSDKIIIIE